MYSDWRKSRKIKEREESKKLFSIPRLIISILIVFLISIVLINVNISDRTIHYYMLNVMNNGVYAEYNVLDY